MAGITILPKVKSFGEEFAGSLSRGLGKGLTEGYTSKLESKKKLAEIENENLEIEKATGIKMPKGMINPDTRKTYFTEELKNLHKNERENKKLKFVQGLTSGSKQQNPGQKLQGQNTQPPFLNAEQLGGQGKELTSQQEGGFNAGNLSDADVLGAEIMGIGALGDLRESNRTQEREKAKIERDENRYQQDIEREKTKLAKTETLPLRKEFADKAKYARQAIENKKSALKLVKSGNLDDPFFVSLASYLPGGVQGKILSTESQLYKSGLFDEFGVVTQMFPGAVRVKELEILEDKLATLDKSDKAKEAILENGIKKAERDIILADAARKVEKNNPNASYLDYAELVQQEAQPKLDKLYEEIVEGYNDIYFKYAPPKSSYVDQNGRRYNDVAKSDLKSLFSEAKDAGLDLRVLK